MPDGLKKSLKGLKIGSEEVFGVNWYCEKGLLRL
jgi:hypothetical protein